MTVPEAGQLTADLVKETPYLSMTQSLPTEWITRISLTKYIEGQDCQLDLKVNVFGEVLEIHNFFLQLPPQARQLMAGDKAVLISKKLKAFEQLLRFCLPLAAMQLLENNEWSGPSRALQRLRRQLAIADLKRYRNRIRDPWVFQAYELAGSDKQPLLSLLAELIENPPLRCTKVLYSINGYHAELAAPVLHHLLDYFADDETAVEHLYVSIGATRSEASRKLLLRHLKQDLKVGYYGAILRGLAYFQQENLRSHLQELFHQKGHLLLEKDFAQLVGAFRKHPGPDSENLLFHVMSGDRELPAKVAFNTLLELGVPLLVITNHLRNNIACHVSPSQVLTSLSVMHGLRGRERKYQLQSRELAELLGWLSELQEPDQRDTNDIQEQLFMLSGDIWKTCMDHNTVRQLLPFLDHGWARVRLYALDIIGQQAREKELPGIVRLLADEDQWVVLKAVDLLEKLCSRLEYQMSSCIEPLLRLLDRWTGTRQARVITVLNALLNLLPDPIALPVLLQHASSRNAEVRLAAVKGLATYGGDQVISTLEELKNDPDFPVRLEAGNRLRQLNDPTRQQTFEDKLADIKPNWLVPAFAALCLEGEALRLLAWENFPRLAARLGREHRMLYQEVITYIRQAQVADQSLSFGQNLPS